MLTEKDYCDYETCVALSELGLSCDDVALHYEAHPLACRYEDIPKPLLYEAQKWLREEKGMLVDSMVFADNSIDADRKVVDRWIYYSFAILNTSTAEFIRSYDHSDEYDTYEEALSEGVRASIKILQDEQKENN